MNLDARTMFSVLSLPRPNVIFLNDFWMDGWMDGRTGGWESGRCMDGWVGVGWMDAWMGGE